MELRERIGKLLTDAGCVGFGFTTAEPFPEVRVRLADAVASGRSAGLPFTFRDPATSTDPGASFPWATSLAVAAMPYVPDSGSPGPASPGTARIARFATSDHYRPLRAALGAVAALLVAAGHRAEVLVDDARLVDRAAAVRAGVGWAGSSTLVLVPGAGPWVLLGSVVTDAALAPTEAMRRTCGTCTACLPACPTGAIIAPGVLDARRCLSAVLQSPGWIPSEVRVAVGDRLYGCDDCLEACPPGDRLLAAAVPGKGRVDVYRLLAADDRSLRAGYPHFFVPRHEGRWLRRNALVVLGNTGGGDAVGVLAGYAAHPDPMLRGHAVWALGRVADARARAVLGVVTRTDPEPDVVAEAVAALA
ncbi:MAG: HEAT repeat domain-containing protein [Acidimicrobiia bacterium]|nr:HEAT repeat domain-containing protein [Acidimicrobiia bacterium]